VNKDMIIVIYPPINVLCWTVILRFIFS